MKNLLIVFGLVLTVAMSVGCDEGNNMITVNSDAMEPEMMEPEPMEPEITGEAMTTITGKVISSGSQCDGMLGGFSNGDEIMIEMNAGGNAQPNGKVTNMTSGNSIGCGGDSGLNDGPLVSILGCITENSQITEFKNGDFMSIMVDFSWISAYKEDITKSAYIINQNINFVDDFDLKKVPCARVMIETITAAGP